MEQQQQRQDFNICSNNSNNNDYLIISNSYSQTLLANFYQMWIKQELTDLRFELDCAKSYCVHRIVIQNSSPFFSSLLSLNLKENKQNVIVLNDICPNSFEIILNYVYTGKIFVTDSNVYDLIVTADYLCFTTIVDICCNYLLRNLCFDNIIDLYEFFDHYSLKQYLNYVRKYMCKYYSKLIKCKEFLNIHHYLLCELLNSDELCAQSEFEIFESVIKWLTHNININESNENIQSLLNCIRVSYIKSPKLLEYINQIENQSVKIVVANYLFEKYTKANAAAQIRISSFIEEPRRLFRRYVLFFGGIYELNRECNGLNSYVYCFDADNLNMFLITKLDTPRSHHCTCEMNDYLFIAGGEIELCISDTMDIYDFELFRLLLKDFKLNDDHDDDNQLIVNSKFEYSEEIELKKANQKIGKPMLKGRTDFGMCAVEDKLFVFGGWIGSEVGDDIEYYLSIENEWYKVPSKLPTLRYEFGCIALFGTPFVYIIGGTTPFETKLSLVERFDTSHYTWQTCAFMNEKRSGFGCVLMNDRIIVIGGYNGKQTLNSVEAYDPLNDRWYLLEPMKYARYGCVAASIENRLFVFGGISCMNTKRIVSSIEYYDFNKNRWFMIDDNKAVLNLFKSSIICI